jgi:hypothetical protein
LKRVLLAAAVIATVVAFFVSTRLPPKQQILQRTFDDGSVAGVLHIHSSRSDGRGTPEQIAHEAARAGLKFIVITDHGDATRTPDPPVYHEGVLCLDGVEISTSAGHYIAIDMPAAPYPLAGEARDVVDDVRRLGGFGIVAHPDSPKPELRWREWTAPFDGLEVFNLDTSWRRRVTDTTWRPKAGLLTKMLTYPVRPAESIASLISRSEIYYRWDALSRRRHVVTVAGADAHAQIAWRGGDPIATRASVPIPSYAASFRALSVRVRTDTPLTGIAAADGAAIFRAIRGGHLYTSVDGVATPPAFEFTATNARATARAGDELPASGPVELRVRSNAPAGFTTTVWQGVTPLADRLDHDFTVTAPAGPAVYWVEIHAEGGWPRLPWITSNPIYVRSANAPSALPVRPPAKTSHALFDAASLAAWSVASDPTSLAALDIIKSIAGESSARFRFGLSGGAPANQFAALRFSTPQGLAGHDRLTFDAHAERPMRISVQLQTATARWHRSIYVDASTQPHTIFLDEFTPVGETETYRVPLADVRNILFVIDTVNTKPGASGRLWIASAAVAE